MLHKLSKLSAPIKRLAFRWRTPDFSRPSPSDSQTARRPLHISRAPLVQMASSKLAPFKSNPPRPSSPSAGTGTARSNVAKTQLKNHQQARMVSNSVNKTALHPGGVEYITPSPKQVPSSNLLRTDPRESIRILKRNCTRLLT